jgi:hypothetical protein
MRRSACTALFGAILLVSHPAQARSLALPPPFLGVSALQYMCDAKFEQAADPASRKTAGECRGYVRAVVDRYFATELKLKEGQIMPACDWSGTADLLIADVRESVSGPIHYSSQSPAEAWLRDLLKKRCEG